MNTPILHFWESHEAYEAARFQAWTLFALALGVMTVSMTVQVFAVIKRRPFGEAFVLLNTLVSTTSALFLLWWTGDWTADRAFFFEDVMLPVAAGCLGSSLVAVAMMVIASVRRWRADRQHAAQPGVEADRNA